MKKSLKILAVALAMLMTLTLAASAASYEVCADELNELSLFRGTDNGYELDTAPTRTHALVMLIRLLGQEEAALIGEYVHPFTDVDEWADNYVGYAYENKLTNGMSETLFGSQELCDAKMYSTFVLRALGYDDAAGDFTYDGAIAFGTETGIIDEAIAEGDFLRDNMVAVSYLALSIQPKDSEFDTLLAKLVEDGAVDAEKAEAFNAELYPIAATEGEDAEGENEGDTKTENADEDADAEGEDEGDAE